MFAAVVVVAASLFVFKKEMAVDPLYVHGAARPLFIREGEKWSSNAVALAAPFDL